VAQRPSQPIEPPHHKRIAGPERGEGFGQDGARGVGAGRGFLEDIDGRSGQPVGLQHRRLIVRRDPRVADQARRAVWDDLDIIPAR
jgi:hypothetical protein